jgi:amidase
MNNSRTANRVTRGVNRRAFIKNASVAAGGIAVGGSLLSRAFASESGLAMSWAEWGKLDATGMARLLAAKQVTPAEVAAQAAKAVELLDPKLNAVVEVFDDVIANPLKDGMDQHGPFHGVPMFVKEAGSTMKGRLRESAMAFMKGNRADKDSPLVRNFRRAGFNLIGRTAIPAGGMHITDSLLEGISRNPWNLERTPGGSSGGSSGAVAAGIVPICHGSDGGGSTRSPAILCGLVGHKPTRGLLPAYSSYYLGPIVTEGVITKSVRDTALAFDQMIHHESTDDVFIPVRLPKVPFAKQIQRDPPRHKIALNTGQWTRTGTKMDPEVVKRVNEVAKLLESLGHTIVEVKESEICDQRLLFDNIRTLLYHYGPDWKALSKASGIPINEKTLEPVYRQQVEYREKNPPTLEIRERERAAIVKISQQVAAFMAKYDALLMPVDLGPASIAGPKNPISPLAPVNNQKEYLEWIELHIDDSRYNTLANFTGVPAIGFPAGLVSSGLPTGAQLYSTWANDGVLMKIAAQIERAKPKWFGMLPPVHVSRL